MWTLTCKSRPEGQWEINNISYYVTESCAQLDALQIILSVLDLTIWEEDVALEILSLIEDGFYPEAINNYNTKQEEHAVIIEALETRPGTLLCQSDIKEAKSRIAKKFSQES
jgi:hypothetical protein